MFKTRLLSGIVLVIVLIVTVGYGGNLLFAFLGIISLIGLTELYKKCRRKRWELQDIWRQSFIMGCCLQGIWNM